MLKALRVLQQTDLLVKMMWQLSKNSTDWLLVTAWKPPVVRHCSVWLFVCRWHAKGKPKYGNDIWGGRVVVELLLKWKAAKEKCTNALKTEML